MGTLVQLTGAVWPATALFSGGRVAGGSG